MDAKRSSAAAETAGKSTPRDTSGNGSGDVCFLHGISSLRSPEQGQSNRHGLALEPALPLCVPRSVRPNEIRPLKAARSRLKAGASHFRPMIQEGVRKPFQNTAEKKMRAYSCPEFDCGNRREEQDGSQKNGEPASANQAGHCPGMPKETRTVVSWPGLLSITSCPPSNSVNRLAMINPRPAPCCS